LIDECLKLVDVAPVGAIHELRCHIRTFVLC
jgi:hypothetical protein